MSAATAGSITRIWRSGPSTGISRRSSTFWRCCRASLQRSRPSDHGSSRVRPHSQFLHLYLHRLPNGDVRRNSRQAPLPRRLHDHRSLASRTVTLPSRRIDTRSPLRFHHTRLNDLSRKHSINHQGLTMARLRVGNRRAFRRRTTKWGWQWQGQGLPHLRLQSQAIICVRMRLEVPSVP
jgi:hypothetical protein